MNDTPPLDSLVRAEATFKAAAARMEDGTASPEVVSQVEAIIVTATRQHIRWGKLTIDALRVLGQYLERNPYRGMGKGGRPPKTVRADSLPTLAERGVKNRRIAARALAVARIKEADWAAYIASGRTSERGLHEFVKDRGLIWDENYSETETGNVVSLASAPNQHNRGHPWWFPSARSKKYLALQATAASEEWYTPPEIFRALNCRFDLDVASPGADQVPWIPADRHFTLADNGLEQDWGDDFVFMNAPYGRGKSPPWLEKFRKHGNGVCLVVDRTSTKWWQDLCGNADLILQVNKKIDFLRPDSDGDDTGTNALGSSLVAYGERGVQALMNAAAAGLGTLFKPCQSLLTSAESPADAPHGASLPERETNRVENYSKSEPAWVTPPEFLAELDKEFHFTKGFDPCPYPRPEGFDGLKVSWPQSTYCNPPFRKKDGVDRQGIAAFARKAIEENKLGKDVVLVLPTKSTINYLLEAGAEFRSAGRINWIDPNTGQPATTSPSSNMLAILRAKPVASTNLPRHDPEEIADLLVAADREKAGEVFWALGQRLASSMSILFLSGHGVENPR